MISTHEPTLRAKRYADLFQPAVVDVFAGCGGWSSGAERAFVEGGYDNRYIDLMINHWDTAVKVHEANHPMTEHLRADVREVDPDVVLPGRRVVYAHFSPDCTDHSKAKGGKPRRKEIRALADVVIVWADKRRPLVITLENVEEFQQWGPLLADGQPDPKKRGEEFKRWVGELRALGYVVEWQEIRASLHGVPTTRKRLFVIARCDGRPIVWPEQTHGISDRRSGRTGVHRPTNGSEVHDEDVGLHRDVALLETSGRPVGELATGDRGRSKANRNGVRSEQCSVSGRLKPFLTAASCINFDEPMLSILATKAEARLWAAAVNVGREKHERVGVPQRPLRPNTQKRLAGGLFKWVLNHASPFIVNIQNSKWGPDHFDISNPMPTVTANPKGGAFAAADVELVGFAGTLNHGGENDRTADLRDPLHTVTGARDARAVVGASIIRCAHGEKSATGKDRWGKADHDPNAPLPTVTGSNDYAVEAVNLAPFSVPRYGEREGQAPRSASLEQPLPTITGTDNGAQVAAVAIVKNNGGPNGNISYGQHAGQPIDTVTAKCQMGIYAAYLSHMYSSSASGGQGDPRLPLKAITGGGQHASVAVVFITPYYGNSTDGSTVTEPMPTVVGRDRFGLINVETTPHWILTLPGLKRARQVATWAKKLLGKKVAPWLLKCVDEAGKAFDLLTATVNGAVHLVTDILMRMLKPRELARAQGFPDDYVIDRTADGTRIKRSDQVKLIGNSVCPELAKRIVKLNVVDQGVLEDVNDYPLVAREAVLA